LLNREYEFGKNSKKNKVLSIAEFNKLINEQIQNQPAPFIYERLEKSTNIFIDEFQDTSENRNKWQNLIPLIDSPSISSAKIYLVIKEV
jgi:hypothetical protein